MTALEQPAIPPCPGCGRDEHVELHKGPQARWICLGCFTVFDGTQSEWERWENHRKERDGS